MLAPDRAAIGEAEAEEDPGLTQGIDPGAIDRWGSVWSALVEIGGEFLGILVLPDGLTRVSVEASDDVIASVISSHQGPAFYDRPTATAFPNLGFPEDLGGLLGPVAINLFG